MDDIIHTTMMNEYFQGRYGTMPVSMKMGKMPLTIIRPLCLEHETDIRLYAERRGYKKQIKSCPYEKDTRRADIQRIFDEIEQVNPEARYSVWNALEKEGKLIFE
jgi:tRNA(Ile)-lysidine synthase TilS/MesJ